MEEIMATMIKKQQNQQIIPNIKSPLSSMHRDSHTISKVKPKIRIIHIFAPEIIKTDVANFRELVQRLTGKPAADHHQKSSKVKKQRLPIKQDHHHHLLQHQQQLRTNLPTAAVMAGNNLGFRETVVKEEEEEERMWNGANSGGFLAGFADLDGFIQELGEFPMLPMAMEANNHHMHGFGETQFA
ncbi:VQ motif-containing protein 17 [Mercurialis annua]|uniref:VQ motif-containing protein 17 n=1 Tax=Mercurialis annua TaxID=3986 RepID=UPI00215E667B|nr:VQ motif-containing protein 17 [Mercurialis annua]